jgi:hypothetical protein
MGDDNYDVSSTSTNTLTIAQGVVAFAATPDPLTTTAGALINLTVQMQHLPAPGSPATGTISVLNGPLNFSGNTVTVSPDPGDGSIISTPLQTFVQDAGNRTIQIHYSGDANYLPADLQVPATVSKIVPTLTVTNFNPVCCVLPFTFRADVTPPGSLFSPKNPTGLFDTLVNSVSSTVLVNIGEDDLQGDCVLSPSTTGHAAGCNPQGEMVSSELFKCTIDTVFTFTYHGDSNYQSQQIMVTKSVPNNLPNCK